MSLSLLRRAILAQSIGVSLPVDVLSVRSAFAGAVGACERLVGMRNVQRCSFAASASLSERASDSTASSTDRFAPKIFRTGTLAVKVGMTQGACPQGFTRLRPFVLALPRSTATRRPSFCPLRPRPPPEFDHHGQRIPLSVLWLDDVQVTQIKPYSASSSSLQLGIGSKRRKQIPAIAGGPL